MNLQWAYMILTFFMFVKLKSANANRAKFKKDGSYLNVRSDTRGKTHRPNRLESPQLNYYYKLLNRPYQKRNIFKYWNNKKHFDVTPFVDLTRDDFSTASNMNEDKNYKFSQDYIDISELARDTNKVNKVWYKFIPEQNKQLLIDIHGNTYQILKGPYRGGRRMVPFQKRSNTDDSDSDDSSTTSDEDEKPKKSATRNSKKNTHKHTPKRFKVINNKSGESDDDDDDDEDDNDRIEVNTSSDTSSKVASDKQINVIDSESKSSEDSSGGLMYIQSPTRHVRTIDVEWRRRLKNFLPKRVHWDERDFQNLRNYWIDGPKGRYPIQYKTPY